jgi:RNA polymerase sigma factor (sigma-70 family)
MSSDSVPASDQPGLVDRIRSGDDAAFGELFQAHESAVRRLARGLVSDASDVEDLTAETFFRVLQAIRRGNGPRENVRAYLLTVARRVSWEWQAARREVPVTDDELVARAGIRGDSQSGTAESALITRAFTSLPERWRIVLWHTEVQGEQPAVVAPHFGLSPNATAALARRARIGLRAAYLQAHLASDTTSTGCRNVVRKLGGYTVGSVTGAEARRIRSHLGDCESCRTTLEELKQVCSSLRAHAGVLALWVPLTGLALAGSGAGAGAGAAVAAGGSATASGVAAGGGAGAAAAAFGTGKFGLTFVSAAAVVGMAGGPMLPDMEVQRREPELPSSGSIRLSEAGDGRSASHTTVVMPESVASHDSTRSRSTLLPAEPARDTHGPTDYTLPAEISIGEGGSATLPTSESGRSETVPSEVPSQDLSSPPETTSERPQTATGSRPRDDVEDPVLPPGQGGVRPSEVRGTPSWAAGTEGTTALTQPTG